MNRYVVSIKPEFSRSLTPQGLVERIDSVQGLRIVEGRGRRTVTVESQSDSLHRIERQLPEVSVRVYEPLALLG